MHGTTDGDTHVAHAHTKNTHSIAQMGRAIDTRLSYVEFHY